MSQQEESYRKELKEPEWESLSGNKIDMQKLLKWGLANSTKNEDPSDGDLGGAASEDAIEKSRAKLDPKWVDIILGKADVIRMKECLEKVRDQTLTIDDRLQACDELELLVEDIDNANDFTKLNLIVVLMDCLKFPEESLRKFVFWILGTMVQNNPFVKRAFINHGVIETILNSFNSDESIEVKTKALFCLGGTLRHNEPGSNIFKNKGGFEIILRELEGKSGKSFSFAQKALFFFNNLLQDNVDMLREQLSTQHGNRLRQALQNLELQDDKDLRDLVDKLIKFV